MQSIARIPKFLMCRFLGTKGEGDSKQKQKPSVSRDDSFDFIDPVEDMFNIIEGSALVPFMEVRLLFSYRLRKALM